MTRPVHARLAWFAVHAVPLGTCNIAVSQPKLVSELARTTVHSVACLQCDLAQRKWPRIIYSFKHSAYMLQPRIKASSYSPSARSDLAQPSILVPVLEAKAYLDSSQLDVKSGHAVPLQN